VIARIHIERRPARSGAVAGVVGADVRGGAGGAERLELTDSRAAVAVQRVAVVTLLAGIEDAVAADHRLLALDRPGVRLDPAGRQPRPLDAEEVRTAGAARDRMPDQGIPDGPGGRRRRRRVPLEPRAGEGARIERCRE